MCVAHRGIVLCERVDREWHVQSLKVSIAESIFGEPCLHLVIALSLDCIVCVSVFPTVGRMWIFFTRYLGQTLLISCVYHSCFAPTSYSPRSMAAQTKIQALIECVRHVQSRNM